MSNTVPRCSKNSRRNLVTSRFLALPLFAFVIAGCGGGGDQTFTTSNTASSVARSALTVVRPSTLTMPSAAESNSNQNVLTGTVGASPVLDASATESVQAQTLSINLLPNSTAATSTGPKPIAHAAIAAATATAPSTATAAATATAAVGTALNPIGGPTAVIAAALSNCASINVGTTYNSTLAASGGYGCYQFTVGATASKIDVKAAIPTGISANAYLYYVSPVTNQLTTVLDTDTTPNNPLLTQAVAQNARLVLAVAPTSGTGGQTFQLGAFNRPGYDSYEPNGKITRAAIVSMNGTVNANVDVPASDTDYYFYQLLPGQTSVEVMVKFSANQSADVRLAQVNTTGGYAYGAESAITSSGATYLFSGLPANGVGSTTPYGLIIRVGGISTAAPTQDPYSLRVGITTAVLNSFSVQNAETFSNLYPLKNLGTVTIPDNNNIVLSYAGAVSAHSYVNMFMKLVDGNGAPVAGEPVTISVFSNIATNPPPPPTVFSTVTDATGNATGRYTFSGCGSPSHTYSYMSISAWLNGTGNLIHDHYTGTAERSLVKFYTANGIKVSRLVAHICSETYLGRY